LQQNTVNDGLPGRRLRSKVGGALAVPGAAGNSTYGASGTGAPALAVTAFHLA